VRRTRQAASRGRCASEGHPRAKQARRGEEEGQGRLKQEQVWNTSHRMSVRALPEQHQGAASRLSTAAVDRGSGCQQQRKQRHRRRGASRTLAPLSTPLPSFALSICVVCLYAFAAALCPSSRCLVWRSGDGRGEMQGGPAKKKQRNTEGPQRSQQKREGNENRTNKRVQCYATHCLRL